FARENKAGGFDRDRADAAAKDALAPFERGPHAENPYTVQHDLQEMMQDLVGIVREEGEMARALDGLARLRVRAAMAGVGGNRDHNPGWHTCLDLANLLTVSEAVTRSGLERRESRGGHFRSDYPEKDPAFGGFNIVVRRDGDGQMRVERRAIPPMPEELRRVIEENT